MATETQAIGVCAVQCLAREATMDPAVGEFRLNAGTIWITTAIAFSRKNFTGELQGLWDFLAAGMELHVCQQDKLANYFHGVCLTVTKYPTKVDVEFDDLTIGGEIDLNASCTITLIGGGVSTSGEADSVIDKILVGEDGAGGFEILFDENGNILTAE